MTGEATRGVEGPDAQAFFSGPLAGAFRFARADDDLEADDCRRLAKPPSCGRGAGGGATSDNSGLGIRVSTRRRICTLYN